MNNFRTVSLSFDDSLKKATKLFMLMLVASIVFLGLVQDASAIERGCKAAYVLVNPSTGGEIYFGGSEKNGNRYNFSARGTCGSSVPNRCRIRARQTVEKCMDIHWDTRWDRVRPEACSEGSRVDNYAVNDLKLHLERRACEKGWGKSGPVRVKLHRKTWGDKNCSGYTLISGYNITPEICKNSGR